MRAWRWQAAPPRPLPRTRRGSRRAAALICHPCLICRAGYEHVRRAELRAWCKGQIARYKASAPALLLQLTPGRLFAAAMARAALLRGRLRRAGLAVRPLPKPRPPCRHCGSPLLTLGTGGPPTPPSVLKPLKPQVPRYWKFVDTFPMTISGKPQVRPFNNSLGSIAQPGEFCSSPGGAAPCRDIIARAAQRAAAAHGGECCARPGDPRCARLFAVFWLTNSVNFRNFAIIPSFGFSILWPFVLAEVQDARDCHCRAWAGQQVKLGSK